MLNTNKKPPILQRMNHKVLDTLVLLLLASFFVSCQEDEMDLPARQQAMIGRAVNFNVSVADRFVTRATSYTNNDDGSFNQNDRMRIYRNYWNLLGSGWESESAYRMYYLHHRYEAGNINLGTDWIPEKGRKGYDDLDEDGTYETFVQAEEDSLTWENGRTVRFKAWSLSNYNNALEYASRNSFYPDYCIADWVNASGPTEGIPLVLKHQGSRIRFVVRQSGNTFHKVELCAGIGPDGEERPNAWKDYKYADNADITDNDNAPTEATKSDEQARLECDSVTEVYKHMCMPAGVDISTGTLMGIKNSVWKGLSDTEVRHLEEQPDASFLKFGQCTSEQVVADSKRPFFCGRNGRQYFITIPYHLCQAADMGEVFVLPACTRFRVYMYDVNSGDVQDGDKYEGKYHIFSLNDIVKRDENDSVALGGDGKPIKMFPNGLKMEAGVSYTFRVGYRYNACYLVVDNNLSWEAQDKAEIEGNNQTAERPVSTTKDYGWWKDAIHEACLTAGTRDYNPVFHINTNKEFLEFINLVNGTAATCTSGLYRLVKSYKETNVGGVIIREPKEYGWSLTNSQFNPQWITEDEAEELGYIFYDHYYPANADQAAHYERDYLKGPFPFYDDNLRLNFKVVLDSDLDLKDWQLESIGNNPSHPFMGKFDGGGHLLKNLNMKDEYLFGYMDGRATDGASVTNLRIESQHNTALLNTGVNPIYLAGISLLAPSTGNSLARSLSMGTGVKGTSFVVGCIHVGDAGGALVGTASDVNMFGCMQAAQGIAGGALIGTDANETPIFKPQIKLSVQKSKGNTSVRPTFKNFMCNFYDTELSPAANAVGSTPDDYSLLEYIRGRNTDILRAKNDFLTPNVPMFTLINLGDWKNYYGLAPWHAMNYAIYWYNSNRGSVHPCNMQFESNTVGYNHRYPTLIPGKPTAEAEQWNPLEQPN